MGIPEQPAESDPMADEFDTLADWTAEVALELGPDYHVPAGCRGSGNPHALDWLIDGLELGATTGLLDVGAGVGGPAAYARQRVGVPATLLEPEPRACRAASRLFGLPVVRADATALPFADGTFDVAWCLGVLCTAPGVAEQATMLAELRRVTTGPIGLLVFLAAAEQLDDPPAGNHFPTEDRLRTLLDGAGLRVADRTGVAELPEPPADWSERTGAVEDALQRRFGGRRPWAVAEEQAGKIGRLLTSGQLRAELLRLERDRRALA